MHFRDLVEATLADVQLVDRLDLVQRTALAVTGGLPAPGALATLAARLVILVHLTSHFAAGNLVRVVGLPATIAGE